MSAAYAYGKPTQTTEHKGDVTILVKTHVPRDPDDPPMESTDD